MESQDPTATMDGSFDVEALRKVLNPTTLWMEEFYLPEQSPMDLQRMISNSSYSLNKAMSTQVQDAIGKERGLLLE